MRHRIPLTGLVAGTTFLVLATLFEYFDRITHAFPDGSAIDWPIILAYIMATIVAGVFFIITEEKTR